MLKHWNICNSKKLYASANAFESRCGSFPCFSAWSKSLQKCLCRFDRESAMPCFNPALLHPCKARSNNNALQNTRHWLTPNPFAGLARETSHKSIDAVGLQTGDLEGFDVAKDWNLFGFEVPLRNPASNHLLAEAIRFNLEASWKIRFRSKERLYKSHKVARGSTKHKGCMNLWVWFIENIQLQRKALQW